MVIRNEHGQNLTEYALMLGLLTLLGYMIMRKTVGTQSDPTTGAVQSMNVTATKKIAADER